MKALIGLGNPGKEYEKTRHNTGFMFVDYLAQTIAEEEKWRLDKNTKSQILKSKSKDLYLVKPESFMNNSGEAVRLFINYYKIPLKDMIIVHDDLDIFFTEYKFQNAKGPKEHKGVLSIENSLKSIDFTRLRIGIENRVSGDRIRGEDYVLQKFTKEELEALKEVFKKITKDIL